MSWLPTLHAEGGPAPWDVVEDSGGLAALFSGYWASQTGLPPAGSGGRGRQLQLACLRSALPWAIRELGLPGAAHRVIGSTHGKHAGGTHAARPHRLQNTSPSPENDTHHAIAPVGETEVVAGASSLRPDSVRQATRHT